jgi:hypothetical protein
LRPYIKDAQKILSRAHETGNPKITQQKIDFLHLPVKKKLNPFKVRFCFQSLMRHSTPLVADY